MYAHTHAYTHTHASQEENGGLYCVWDLQVSLRGPSQAENFVFWCFSFFFFFHFYVTSNGPSLAVQTQQRNETSTLNRGDFSPLVPLSSSEVREIMDSERKILFWGELLFSVVSSWTLFKSLFRGNVRWFVALELNLLSGHAVVQWQLWAPSDEGGRFGFSEQFVPPVNVSCMLFITFLHLKPTSAHETRNGPIG